jgi:osmoprotectant transport system substrate-binding protein
VSARALGGLLGVLAAGLALGGCGGGGPAPTPVAHHSTAGSRSGPARVTTATVAATSTTTTSTTTAALPGTGRPVVTIGDKNYTEQFVLGQLYLQALKAQGFSVNITDNIGPPAVIKSALKTGSLAMYPEYLDVFNQTFTHLHRPVHSRAAAEQAARRWAGRHGLQLLTPTPFGDTDGIAVTVAAAARHRLRTLGDLRRVATHLVVGGAVQFEKAAPGLPSLARAYGVVPASFQSLAVGDQYDELNEGSIGAAYVNTTDGQLSTGDYRVLADPRRIFGYGNVVPVLSDAAAAKEGPAFAATIDRVDRTLTLRTMRTLNYAVDVAGQKPAAVAQQYLQTHGLLTPLRGFTAPTG